MSPQVLSVPLVFPQTQCPFKPLLFFSVRFHHLPHVDTSKNLVPVVSYRLGLCHFGG